MPYIAENIRQQYDEQLESLPEIISKGELEYCIFKLMRIFMRDRGYTYTHLHDCVYAAAHCADEFRRRFLDTREDDAMKVNGDINA